MRVAAYRHHAEYVDVVSADVPGPIRHEVGGSDDAKFRFRNGILGRGRCRSYLCGRSGSCLSGRFRSGGLGRGRCSYLSGRFRAVAGIIRAGDSSEEQRDRQYGGLPKARRVVGV